MTVEKRHEIATQLQHLIDDTGAVQPLKLLCRARSMVLLAKLLNDTPDDLMDTCYGTLGLASNTSVLLNNALQLCPDDPFILERCGPLLRSSGFIEQCIQVLRKAVDQKETAYSCEHLARSLTRKYFFRDSKIRPMRLPSRITKGENSILSSLCTPRDVMKLENEGDMAVTHEILHMLDRSFELDTNFHALYEKGRFLRQIGRQAEAIKVFRYIVRRKASCSLMILANSYTNAVYCLIHELSDLWNDGDRLVLLDEMKSYMRYSVELSLKLVTRFVYNDDKLIPVLSDLLKGKRVQHAEYYEMNNLSSVIRMFGGGIGILVALQRDDMIENILTLVKRCMETQQIEEAIIGLQLMLCLRAADIDERKISAVLVEGAIQAGVRGDFDVAGIRLKDALSRMRIHSLQQEAEERLDIYIICEPEAEELWRPLIRILQNIGLNASLNMDNALNGDQRNDAWCETFLKSTMDTCNSLLICVSSSVMTDMFRSWTAKALQDSTCGVAVLKTRPDADVSDLFTSTVPMVDVDLQSLQTEHGWKDEPFQLFVKSVFTKLALERRNIN